MIHFPLHLFLILDLLTCGLYTRDCIHQKAYTSPHHHALPRPLPPPARSAVPSALPPAPPSFPSPAAPATPPRCPCPRRASWVAPPSFLLRSRCVSRLHGVPPPSGLGSSLHRNWVQLRSGLGLGPCTWVCTSRRSSSALGTGFPSGPLLMGQAGWTTGSHSTGLPAPPSLPPLLVLFIYGRLFMYGRLSRFLAQDLFFVLFSL